MAAPPFITSISPTSGQVGTNVSITGTGFTSYVPPPVFHQFPAPVTPKVYLSGIFCPITYNTATLIICSVPPGAVTGNIVVTTYWGSSNGVLFTVAGTGGAPTLTSLTPATGKIGTHVTIAGTNFGATQGMSTVTINAVAAIVTSWSATSIGITIPNTASTGPVIVTVGGVASNSLTLTISPPSNGGTPAPLNLILIPGQNFNTPQVWTLDPTNFDDQANGSFYFWKVEDIVSGHVPKVGRVLVTYRDLGPATVTFNLTGSLRGSPLAVSSGALAIGNAQFSPTNPGPLCVLDLGITLSCDTFQLSMVRAPGGGPISIVKIRMEGNFDSSPLG